MTIVTVHQAKTNLSRLIAEALGGEEVVIAKGDTPVARLVPVQPPAKRRFGALKGEIVIDPAFHDPLPEDEIAAWDGE